MIFCAAMLAVQMVAGGVVCFAEEVEKAAELKFPARESFREFSDVWGGGKDGKGEVGGQHTKITVSPAELPYPLLKYRFNVYVTEIEAGNAAPLYEEAIAKLAEIQQSRERGVYQSEGYARAKFPELFKIPQDKIEENAVEKLRFNAFPLKTNYTKVYDVVTPSQELQLFQSLDSVYKLVEKASRKRECDWSYRRKLEGIATLLPEVQGLRQLGRYLQSKANWEIRNGNYDDAIKTIRLGWRITEHMEQSDFPCLVTLLVSTAIKGVMMGQIQLLSTQPDAPNLYPALTQIYRGNNLMQKGMQCEQYFWMLMNSNPAKFQELFENVSEKSSKEDCKQLLEDIVTTFAQVMQDFKNFDKEAAAKNLTTIISVACYPLGKEWLLTRGLTEAEINNLSVYQVVTPYIAQRIKATYDRMLVTAKLPIDADKVVTFFDEKEVTQMESPVDVYLSLFVPATMAAQKAFLRTEQALDLLLLKEAIRYHAATNDGKLPNSLDDIKQLHVNKIGATNNKPFKYQSKNNTATIDYYIPAYSDSRLEIIVEKEVK
jgi:hypothetical protein